MSEKETTILSARDALTRAMKNDSMVGKLFVFSVYSKNNEIDVNDFCVDKNIAFVHIDESEDVGAFPLDWVISYLNKRIKKHHADGLKGICFFTSSMLIAEDLAELIKFYTIPFINWDETSVITNDISVVKSLSKTKKFKNSSIIKIVP